jgi:4-amino-4-deoxy-L-arabinose transferase-like glycosyltransferase
MLPAPSDRRWFWLAAPAMVAPGLLWACLDYRPWPWDQAQYAEYTLRTLAAFKEAPLAGFAAMGVLMGVKPPGLTWLGVPFAQLAELFGRPEPALLCATLAFQAGTLLACCWSAYRISGSALTALAVTAFIGSTPLFIALNQHYLVEPLQTFAVALSFLLALYARDLSRLALVLALCGVAALALAAKATSPFYCTLPLLIAASALAAPRPIAPGRGLRILRVPLVLLTLLALVLVTNWYVTNFSTMLENAQQSTVGALAHTFGSAASFPAKLAFWTKAFAAALFFPSALVLAAAVAGALIAWRRQPAARPSDGAMTVAAAAALIAAGLVAYSLQMNEGVRFLEPFLPACAIVLAWLCTRRSLAAASGALLATALAQFLLVYGYAFGLSPKAFEDPFLQALQRDATERSRLLRVVEFTCDPGRPFDPNLVGVQYPWLNPASANFYAVAAHGGRPVCRYISLEQPTDDPAVTLKKLDQLVHRYYISVLPEKMPPPDFVNRASAAAFAKVAQSPDWERVRTVDDIVVIFRSKRY